MKLYNAALSPFAARVRLSIYRKGLEDRIAVVPPPDGGLKGDAYRSVNPMRRVPTLELDDGVGIPESAVILEYLEDAFPEPSLRPRDPALLARARLFLRLPDIYLQNAPRTLLSMRDPATRKPELVEEALGHVHQTLAYIDAFLDGGAWAVGGAPSIADCATVPVLFVLTLVGRIYDQPDLFTRHARVAAYWDAARAEPVHARVIGEQMAAVPRP